MAQEPGVNPLDPITTSGVVKVDSVNVVEGSQVPTSPLEGEELWNFLKGPVGSRTWKKITSAGLKNYARPCADTLYRSSDTLFLKNTDCQVMWTLLPAAPTVSEWQLETFLDQTGSTITVVGILPTNNQSEKIRVMRPGAELILGEDYTISNNIFTFMVPLDREHVKIWFKQ